jgi:hypothetical protein
VGLEGSRVRFFHRSSLHDSSHLVVQFSWAIIDWTILDRMHYT